MLCSPRSMVECHTTLGQGVHRYLYPLPRLYCDDSSRRITYASKIHMLCCWPGESSFCTSLFLSLHVPLFHFPPPSLPPLFPLPSPNPVISLAAAADVMSWPAPSVCACIPEDLSLLSLPLCQARVVLDVVDGMLGPILPSDAQTG